jgi:prophage regulatory protein
MPALPEQITLRVRRLPAVMDRTGLTAPTIYRLMQLGLFPRQILLGGNSRGWLDHEITAWLEDRVGARDSGADAGRRINANIGKGRPGTGKGRPPQRGAIAFEAGDATEESDEPQQTA